MTQKSVKVEELYRDIRALRECKRISWPGSSQRLAERGSPMKILRAHSLHPNSQRR